MMSPEPLSSFPLALNETIRIQGEWVTKIRPVWAVGRVLSVQFPTSAKSGFAVCGEDMGFTELTQELSKRQSAAATGKRSDDG